MFSKLVAHQFRHRKLWLTGILVFFLGCLSVVHKLRVRSDFKLLLPQNKPSVTTLNEIIQEVGGVDSLIITIECDDYKATERFIEDLVRDLRDVPPGMIRYIDYNVSNAKSFFEKHKYLYMDFSDLVSLRQRIAKKIQSEKLKSNPLYFNLEEDESADDFDISDLKEKYSKEGDRFSGYTDGYYFAEDNHFAAVVVRPYGASTSVESTEKLMVAIDRVIEKLGPATYDPTMKIRYSGKSQETIKEYKQIIYDMLETLSLCLVLVAISIYLYFWRVRVIFYLSIPLAVGAVATFAITKGVIGYLNSQTAFLGSIIVGNGINTGIILLARYLEERRKGNEMLIAMKTSLESTWKGTLCAAVTTSAGFACLLTSEIKGFSHFGFIGGIGMTLTWCAYHLVLPPVVFFVEKKCPLISETGRVRLNQWQGLFDYLAAFLKKFDRSIAVVGILVAGIGAAHFYRFLPDSLEYDFSKLRNRYRETGQTEGAFKQRVTNIFGQNTSPSTILIDHPDQAREVCEKVSQAEKDIPIPDRTIDHCQSIDDFIPQDQPRKLAELKKIRTLLQDSTVNFAKGKDRVEIDALRKAALLKPVRAEDLPLEVRRNFMRLDGTVGRFVYVYPTPDAKLSNGKRLIQFADHLSSIRLSDGSVFRTSGQSAIFADLLKAVKKDGPVATVLSFVAVCLLALLIFRSLRSSVYVIFGLCLGALYMFGLQSWIGIKLNFFNFIAIPVTYGIGIDYGVNLYQRHLQEKDILVALRQTGSAIFLCSITTFISYVTLLTAQNQALVSFGWLAILGEVGCLTASLIVMPALLMLWQKRISKKTQSDKPKAAEAS